MGSVHLEMDNVWLQQKKEQDAKGKQNLEVIIAGNMDKILKKYEPENCGDE
jgi:hypothetical protein